LLEADDWVEHTDLVIDRVHHVQQLVVDMQTGMRGYRLTGDPNFLQPYTVAEAAVDVTFNGLGRLVADNPAQIRSLIELRGAYVQWHQHAHETIALRRGGEEGLQELTLSTRDKAMMDVLRASFATFIAVESDLRDRRSEAVREAANFASKSLLVATLLLGGIIAFVARYQLIRLSRSYEDALTVERWTHTKLVESSDALRANEERFHAFMDNTPAVAFIKDSEGRYLYVNKRWDHLFRVKHGDLLGKTDLDVWPEALAKRFCESDQAALATGQTQEEVQSILASNGETRYWMTLKFPIRDAAGSVLLAGMSIDVTGRKRAAKRTDALPAGSR